MYFCQMLAIAEVINPALGLVKTALMPSFIQVRIVDHVKCTLIQVVKNNQFMINRH